MIYVLHFHEKIGDPDNPRGQAQHYIGWAADEAALAARIAEHRRGNGAAITAYLARRGIGFVVALVLTGDRNEERRLKRRKDTPRWCPVCQQAHEEGRHATPPRCPQCGYYLTASNDPAYAGLRCCDNWHQEAGMSAEEVAQWQAHNAAASAAIDRAMEAAAQRKRGCHE